MKQFLGVLVLAALVFYMCGPKKTAVRHVGNGGTDIVAFGDSLTYGKGAAREESYPALLQQGLGRRVVNLGRNGETAVGAAARIQEALAGQPYMVLIEFGGNDVMRSVPFEQTVAAMERMVDAVQQAGAVAVVVDTGGSSLMGRYSKAYKKLARAKGAVFVPGILDGLWGKRELMSDQVHPNARGYRLVADKVQREIAPYL